MTITETLGGQISSSSATAEWVVELATTTEATAWVDTTRAITAAWLAAWINVELFVTTASTGASSFTQSKTHSLWRVPTRFEFTWVDWNTSTDWFLEVASYASVDNQLWTHTDCIWILYDAPWQYFKITIENITSVGFDMVYTATWVPWTWRTLLWVLRVY